VVLVCLQQRVQLLAAFMEACAAVAEQAPLAEFLLRVLVLVHRPRHQVMGYRPITLLNIDIRLLCLVLVQRLHLPLGPLVASTQSDCSGRRDK
jgi:hypothetical protein